MQVVQFTRKPGQGFYSIESTFAAMRSRMNADVNITVWECPFSSRGVVRKMRNLMAARSVPGDVCHILGDVHYLALGMRAATTILTIHDCGFAHNPNWIRRTLLRWFWLALPARRVAKVCAISEKTKQEILRLTDLAPEKIAVIPDCISDDFRAVPKPALGAVPVILQIGTLPNKNVPRLIAALAGIPCVLRIVGRPTPEIEEAIRVHGITCHFSERLKQSELVAAYENADLVSFVSTYEGFGMPIVEAQAIGRAVITSDIEPMRNVAGGAAALADPYSVASIRSQIEKLIADGDWRERLISKGWENVRHYRADVVAEKYRGVYKDVLARASAR